MDIQTRNLLYLKAGLFVLGGVLASTGILLEAPSLRVAVLLAVAIWCFAPAYYFIFYVIEHYIDPGYRFAGLGAFICYMLRRKREEREEDAKAAEHDDKLATNRHK